MDIPDDVLQAVAYELRQYRFAARKFPDMPVADVTTCGCTGPLPDCPCAFRNRLIGVFFDILPEPPQ